MIHNVVLTLSQLDRFHQQSKTQILDQLGRFDQELLDIVLVDLLEEPVGECGLSLKECQKNPIDV